MARSNNKYTSINYNHILQRDASSTSPASYSSVARSNGRMLVLTKPSPKPLKASSVAATTTPPPLSPAPKTPDEAICDPDPNQISLRPLGHTGPGSSLSFPARTQEPDKEVSAPAPMSSMSPKPDRFVPPHLRPGFVRKDERPGLDSSRAKDASHQQQPRQGYSGYGQTGRPKSGGYERIRSDPDYLGRPRSSGNRPGTSGCCDYNLDDVVLCADELAGLMSSYSLDDGWRWKLPLFPDLTSHSQGRLKPATFSFSVLLIKPEIIKDHPRFSRFVEGVVLEGDATEEKT